MPEESFDVLILCDADTVSVFLWPKFKLGNITGFKNVQYFFLDLHEGFLSSRINHLISIENIKLFKKTTNFFLFSRSVSRDPVVYKSNPVRITDIGFNIKIYGRIQINEENLY